MSIYWPSTEAPADTGYQTRRLPRLAVRLFLLLHIDGAMQRSNRRHDDGNIVVVAQGPISGTLSSLSCSRLTSPGCGRRSIRFTPAQDEGSGPRKDSLFGKDEAKPGFTTPGRIDPQPIIV